MVALESMALSLAKTIVQKAAGAWIADRRTAEERKKELRALLTPGFRRGPPEQQFLKEAVSELASLGHEFRGLDDGDRVAALLAVHKAFKDADLTDRTLFAVDLDAAKLASRLRAGQPGAKTAAGLGEVGGAFYDAALDRCCELYVRAVEQVPAFVGRSLAEILSRFSDLSDQVADLPGQVAARVVEAQAAVADRPDSDVTMAGRLLEEVTDPFVLEVHRPVQLEDAPPGLPVLPRYVPREHDEVLGQVVRAAADGRSGIAVLVGGSSTGKTRACWEALDLLRDQDPPWRLWHPIDPSPPDAALAELPGIEPRTVVWLNEAQLYIDTADEQGERVAARLRGLLRDPVRAPALILATMWPGFWDTLAARPPEGAPDPYAQARELLAGHDITVPATFTPAQLSQLTQTADVRLALATRSAPDGAVIQFLAGAPELLARYRNASPAAAALIHAAMDARRLGMGAGLPQAFLEVAAPGYLTDDQWDALREDWLEQALHYTAKEAKGVRGPLTRIRPARHAARNRGDQPASMATAEGPLYRLADYLDQHGRQHRKGQFPPAGFWAAAAGHAFPADQAALGDAAHARGLYRDAAQLHKNAAAGGNLRAVFYLSKPPDCLRPDVRPMHWAVAHVLLDEPGGVARLLDRLRKADAQEQVTALLHRDPAAHVALGDPDGVARLLDSLREADAPEQVTALLHRDPAAHVALGDPYAVARLLDRLREAGAPEQVTALLHRDPAAHVALGDPGRVAILLDSLREADAQDQVTALADRAAALFPLSDPGDAAILLVSLAAGAPDQVTALADRAAALDDPLNVALLLVSLREADAQDQVTALLHRDPAAHVALGDPEDVAGLLDSLREADAQDQVTALLHRDPAAHVALGDPDGVADLLDSLRAADAQDQVTALLHRDPAAHVALDDPRAVARLLDRLQAADAPDQVTALADRAAALVSLGDPYAVAWLLHSLREAGAQDQVTALADRAAALVSLGDPYAVALLLDSLRKADAQDQVTALLHRDPAAHVAQYDPLNVASLLHSLREAGAQDQVTALLHRDPAAHVALGDARGVAILLDSLWKEGAQDQVTLLVDRLPAEGLFDLFCAQGNHQALHRFGRNPDGSPAEPWDWENLD